MQSTDPLGAQVRDNTKINCSSCEFLCIVFSNLDMDPNCGLFFEGLFPRKSREAPAPSTVPVEANRFYPPGCAKPKLADVAESTSSSAPFVSWASLGLTGSTLDTAHALGYLFPNTVQRAVIPQMLAGKSASVSGVEGSHELSYLLPLIQKARESELFFAVVLCADQLCAKRAFGKAIALTKGGMIGLALAQTPEDVSSTAANANILFLEASLWESLTKLASQRTISAFVLDGISSMPAATDLAHVAVEFEKCAKGAQLILFTSERCDLPALPKICVDADLSQDSITHACVRVSTSAKTKLAMLLAQIHMDRQSNFVIVTKHTAALHRIQMLCSACGRKAEALENTARDAEVRQIISAMKRSECDVLVVKSDFPGSVPSNFADGKVTVIYYDAPDTVEKFVERTSDIFGTVHHSKKVVSFLHEDDEKLLVAYQCVMHCEGGQFVSVQKRTFSDGVLTEAREYIAAKMDEIRALLELRSKERSRAIQENRKRQADVPKNTAGDADVEKLERKLEAKKKKAKPAPAPARPKHEKNSYAEKMTENKKRIKKAKSLNDLKGILPKGKFRKIRKRTERMERRKNPSLRSKQPKGAKQRGRKGRR